MYLASIGLLTRSRYPFISPVIQTWPSLLMPARSLNTLRERFLDDNQTLNHAESKRVLSLTVKPTVPYQIAAIQTSD